MGKAITAIELGKDMTPLRYIFLCPISIECYTAYVKMRK